MTIFSIFLIGMSICPPFVFQRKIYVTGYSREVRRWGISRKSVYHDVKLGLCVLVWVCVCVVVGVGLGVWVEVGMGLINLVLWKSSALWLFG